MIEKILRRIRGFEDEFRLHLWMYYFRRKLQVAIGTQVMTGYQKALRACPDSGRYSWRILSARSHCLASLFIDKSGFENHQEFSASRPTVDTKHRALGSKFRMKVHLQYYVLIPLDVHRIVTARGRVLLVRVLEFIWKVVLECERDGKMRIIMFKVFVQESLRSCVNLVRNVMISIRKKYLIPRAFKDTPQILGSFKVIYGGLGF
ncbi:hypothetical protein F5878DRAFT_629491 [Lentinula raphanica]|uniref:Uncharacterized protein n=1 Tax=Lentinula raphanica TaxID=153919 RepID=A0AA38UEA7_9AGAR|nr:hypothetical protein F5878DRAFT_629491 [Lentinula raphanica]